MGLLCLHFMIGQLNREQETGNRKQGRVREGMTCSKGPQGGIEGCSKDTASVCGVPALLTEPPGAPCEQILNLFFKI